MIPNIANEGFLLELAILTMTGAIIFPKLPINYTNPISIFSIGLGNINK